MPSYTFYRDSGEIVGVLSCPEDHLETNQIPGCRHIEEELDARTMWCPGGVPTAKQDIGAIVNGTTVSGLPTPLTRALIEGTFYDVTDGVLELDANLPGPYTVRLLAVGHFDKEIVIP